MNVVELSPQLLGQKNYEFCFDFGGNSYDQAVKKVPEVIGLELEEAIIVVEEALFLLVVDVHLENEVHGTALENLLMKIASVEILLKVVAFSGGDVEVLGNHQYHLVEELQETWRSDETAEDVIQELDKLDEEKGVEEEELVVALAIGLDELANDEHVLVNDERAK